MNRAASKIYFRPEFSTTLSYQSVPANYNQNHMSLVLPVTYHELYRQKPLKIYWKTFIGNITFWQQEKYKLSNKFTLNFLSSGQSLFSYWNETRDSEKCPSGELSVVEISFRGIIRLGNCTLQKCAFRELSVRKTVLGGTASQRTFYREMSLGNCSSGKSPDTGTWSSWKLHLHQKNLKILFIVNIKLFLMKILKIN